MKKVSLMFLLACFTVAPQPVLRAIDQIAYVTAQTALRSTCAYVKPTAQKSWWFWSQPFTSYMRTYKNRPFTMTLVTIGGILATCYAINKIFFTKTGSNKPANNGQNNQKDTIKITLSQKDQQILDALQVAVKLPLTQEAIAKFCQNHVAQDNKNIDLLNAPISDAVYQQCKVALQETLVLGDTLTVGSILNPVINKNAGSKIESGSQQENDVSNALKTLAFALGLISVNPASVKDPNIDTQDEDGQTRLMREIDGENLEEVKNLIDNKKANLDIQDKSGKTALIRAIKHPAMHSPDIDKHNLMREIVEKIINAGANLNIKSDEGKTALILAAHFNVSDIVKLLIENKVDVNTKNNQGRTALMVAAEQLSIESLKILLNTAEIDVNAQDNGGRTALMLSINYSHSNSPKISQMLVDYEKTNLNIQDNDGRTALHYAVYSPLQLISLLAAGADPNIQDKTGLTVLMSAALGNQIDSIKELIKYNVQVNMQNTKKETALMIAAAEGHLNVMKLLIEAGADQTLQDQEGRTALDLARTNKHEESVEYLESL